VLLKPLVIAQVVGWAKSDPTTKASAITRESCVRFKENRENSNILLILFTNLNVDQHIKTMI
jgi:hypothetical protein